MMKRGTRSTTMASMATTTSIGGQRQTGSGTPIVVGAVRIVVFLSLLLLGYAFFLEQSSPQNGVGQNSFFLRGRKQEKRTPPIDSTHCRTNAADGGGSGSSSSSDGLFGTPEFRLYSTRYASMWHDVPLFDRPTGAAAATATTAQQSSTVVPMVTEIPMGYRAKMELQKALPNNPVAQDLDSRGAVRFYTYGDPFFNYGFLPQTWEDPGVVGRDGVSIGDNDPLDVMEIGGLLLPTATTAEASDVAAASLPMGSVTPCRVLGMFELIDQGETDYKIICIREDTGPPSNLGQVRSLPDVDRIRPGTTAQLRDWLVNYKTTDGKPPNTLADGGEPASARDAMLVIHETHDRWKTRLCDASVPVRQLPAKAHDFWLQSPSCRGSSIA